MEGFCPLSFLVYSGAFVVKWVFGFIGAIPTAPQEIKASIKGF